MDVPKKCSASIGNIGEEGRGGERRLGAGDQGRGKISVPLLDEKIGQLDGYDEDTASSSNTDTENESEAEGSKRLKMTTIDMDASDSDSEDYFKNSEQIEEMISKAPKSVPPYIGNLNYSSGYKVLKHGYVCLRKTTDGTLAPNKPQHFVLLKRLRYKTECGSNGQIFLCFDCNESSRTEVLLNAVSKDDIVTENDLKSSIISCVHSYAAEYLYTKDEVEAAISNKGHSTILRNDKLIIVACFDQKSYGIVYCNKAWGGNKTKCNTCKNSTRCNHVNVWNNEKEEDRFLSDEININETPAFIKRS